VFLPDDDPRAARVLAVLGSKVARELFGGDSPLGARIRIGGERYRVVGVMESKGQVLGFDLDDTVYIPVGRALDMFNRESLMEIEVTYEPTAPLAEVEEGIRRVLIARHGVEDFTITPQQKMLEVFGTVLDAVTFVVAAIGGISLVVGGVGILTILTIAVAERTSEIGLLKKDLRAKPIGSRRMSI
jgi:putative ABC transport system permease protein